MNIKEASKKFRQEFSKKLSHIEIVSEDSYLGWYSLYFLSLNQEQVIALGGFIDNFPFSIKLAGAENYRLRLLIAVKDLIEYYE